MPNPGPIDQNRDLLADLKQDEQNAKANNEPQATQEHIAGTQRTQPLSYGTSSDNASQALKASSHLQSPNTKATVILAQAHRAY